MLLLIVVLLPKPQSAAHFYELGLVEDGVVPDIHFEFGYPHCPTILSFSKPIPEECGQCLAPKTVESDSTYLRVEIGPFYGLQLSS